MKNNQVEILLVEDNPDDAELTMMALEENKNIARSKIHFAKDGIEALEYLFASEDETEPLNHHPEMILLDLRLPKIDGLEVLKQIRLHPEAKDIPVIILTASHEIEDWIDSYSFDIDFYIRKSVNFDQFVEAIGWALLNTIEQRASLAVINNGRVPIHWKKSSFLEQIYLCNIK